MNIVDGILIAALVVFGYAGWRRGFIAGVLSFSGFIAGGLLGAFVLPSIVAATSLPAFAAVAVVVLGVVLLAVMGQVLASILGTMLRGFVTWQPARVVDNAGGAALNVLALAVVTWIVVGALAYLPASPMSEQMQASRVLVGLDALVPPQVRNVFGSLRDLVGSSAVPRIFSGLGQVTGPDVAAPDPDVVPPVAQAARGSIVKVTGATPECTGGVSGSGFVIESGRVITNAHVVAGVEVPGVRVRAGDALLPTTVVYFDPSTDIAILDVPGLSARPLLLAEQVAASGDPAIIAGFPESGPFRAEPARIRTQVTARGDDIYGNAGVEREVYVLRGLVLPGNSGGPLLDPDGRALGMVFGAADGEQGTGYALTAGELRSALAAAEGSAGPVDTGSCRLRE